MVRLIKYLPSAGKKLNILSQNAHKRIIKAISKLKDNPRPSGCKKLKSRDAYRIRVGDYRIIYEIRDNMLVVLVIRIAHRHEAYK